MTYRFLTNAGKVVDWARQLVNDLNVRDAQLQKQIDDLSARVKALEGP